MTFILEVLRHTPPWVFLLLGYIGSMGVRGSGTRTLPLTRVWLTPVVFIGLGVSGRSRDTSRWRSPGRPG